MYAAAHGAVSGILALLECGADAGVECLPGATALMFASTQGYKEAARTLVEVGRASVAQETQLDTSTGSHSTHHSTR